MSEKAGIIKPGATAVIGVRDPELVALVEAEGPERCWRLDHEVTCTRSQLALGGRLVDLRTPMGEHREVFVPLHGEHQGDNAALALGAVCALFDRDVAPELVASGFASVRVPGRLEVVGRRPLVILDGAHNPPALAALARAVNDEFEVPGARFVVFGMLGGRDPEAALAQLVDLRPDLVVCVPVPSPEPSPGSRAGDPAALARIGDELGLPTRAVADLDAATRLLRRTVTADDVVVVAGSFRLLEPARATLVPALAALTV